MSERTSDLAHAATAGQKTRRGYVLDEVTLTDSFSTNVEKLALLLTWLGVKGQSFKPGMVLPKAI